MNQRLDQLRGSQFKEISVVAVDSGQIMIVDPCYVLPDDMNEGSASYESVLDAYKGDHNQPFIEPWGSAFGTVVGTLYGDGVYRVYARMVDGRCAQVLIDFEQLDN